MVSTAPIVRVQDASHVPSGGAARLVLSRLPHAKEVADAVAAARGVCRWEAERLLVTAVPARLVDAAGRVGGAGLAEEVGAAVDAAVDAWLHGSTDVETRLGTLPTSKRPLVVGVLNVTPDSFFDGGVHYESSQHPGLAIEAGRRFVTEGADLVDVGGESSRPGAEPVEVEEELARVLPVVEALAAEGVRVSVDTTKARVARKAVEAGAVIVNDVSAGGFDDQLLPTIADLGVPYVLMHMRGTPRTMQDDPRYDDVVAEVFDFLADRLAALERVGVRREQVVVDPGIGFGKRVEHNLALLRRIRELTSLGRPVLVGASHKTFIGQVTGVDDPADRVEGSLAAAALAVAEGARLVRVHDVRATARAVAVAHAIATA